jgi:serine/threonine protein kinase
LFGGKPHQLDRLRHRFRSKRLKHVWLGVHHHEIDCLDEQFDDYHFGRKLGSGGFGTVHEACKARNCRYVLKVSFLQDAFDREVAEREIAMAKALEPTGLTIPIIQHKMCGDKLLQIMPRMDMTVEQLGIAQFDELFGADANALRPHLMLFTDRQLQRLFSMALQISSYGVILGDLKLDNILYTVATDDFRFIDFGFTGDYQTHGGKVWEPHWGWTHIMGCNQHKPISQDLVPAANIWQLLADFAHYPVILVAIENRDDAKRAPGRSGARRLGHLREIRLFVGLGPRFAKVLNRDALRQVQSECPNIRGQAYQERQEFAPVRDRLLRKLSPYWV